MLSDDEFLRSVLPQLRAKTAAQGRSSDSSHGSADWLSSPKNDPNGHDRKLWFPSSLTQLNKFGDKETVQVRAYAEPLHAALSSDVDGWITLSEMVMNGQKEKVALVSLRSLTITAGDGVQIGVNYVVELRGLELSPSRTYFVRMKCMDGDSNKLIIKRLWADWKSRKEARGKAADEWLASPRLTISDIEKAEKRERQAERELEILRRKLMGES